MFSLHNYFIFVGNDHKFVLNSSHFHINRNFISNPSNLIHIFIIQILLWQKIQQQNFCFQLIGCKELCCNKIKLKYSLYECRFSFIYLRQMNKLTFKCFCLLVSAKFAIWAKIKEKNIFLPREMEIGKFSAKWTKAVDTKQFQYS